jgi:suppressor of tumorigenicity protein 13
LYCLTSLHPERVKDYIGALQNEIVNLGGTLPSSPEEIDTDTTDAMKEGEEEDDDDVVKETKDNNKNNVFVDYDDGFQVPQYESGEDYETQADLKMKATDASNEGKLEEALDLFNQAVQAAPPSALLYANRAMVLEKLHHFKAAETDCNKALEQNPDSAKALKARGKLRYQHLNDWMGALSDLSQAQTIDYDPDIVAMLEELTKLRVQKEKEEAHERIEKEEKLKKKSEEIKKAQEQARRQEEDRQQPRSAAGMPGGIPGGMPGGMPDMSSIMSDPEIVEAMQNPKVGTLVGKKGIV